jgi:hypothetical protein
MTERPAFGHPTPPTFQVGRAVVPGTISRMLFGAHPAICSGRVISPVTVTDHSQTLPGDARLTCVVVGCQATTEPSIFVLGCTITVWDFDGFPFSGGGADADWQVTSSPVALPRKAALALFSSSRLTSNRSVMGGLPWLADA